MDKKTTPGLKPNDPMPEAERVNRRAMQKAARMTVGDEHPAPVNWDAARDIRNRSK